MIKFLQLIASLLKFTNKEVYRPLARDILVEIQEDNRLFTKIVNNNETAFKEFYNHSSKAIFKMLRLYLNNEEAAEVLEDTFIEVWRDRHRLRDLKLIRLYVKQRAFVRCNDYHVQSMAPA